MHDVQGQQEFFAHRVEIAHLGVDLRSLCLGRTLHRIVPLLKTIAGTVDLADQGVESLLLFAQRLARNRGLQGDRGEGHGNNRLWLGGVGGRSRRWATYPERCRRLRRTEQGGGQSGLILPDGLHEPMRMGRTMEWPEPPTPHNFQKWVNFRSARTLQTAPASA
ncbi:hypothetical protein [Thiomonas sp.]|uniref:hypothetical protein n=2 Tax=unclassified Thiomonas TaxID=2625466 RepID=UPI002589CB75|nr:hypothetical protein [Thiomonas sp.]